MNEKEEEWKEKAGKAFGEFTYDFLDDWDQSGQCFWLGVNWVRKNPPPETEHLISALEFCLKHLESMENYSLISGARHEMNLALNNFKEKK